MAARDLLQDGEPIIRLQAVCKTFATHQAVADVTLDLERGELLTLLGSSGCGKSTLLRMIAGFERVTSGSIQVAGEDVTRYPPERRPTAMVFQSYALFPHLSVFDNVAFGLRLRKRPAADIRSLVRNALGMVQMDGFEQRFPSELSGGQQQRVALARCLVIEPKILLLDEPFGALDRSLREQMQVELRKLQKKLGITMLVVTHDQEEAFVLSDRIAVMNGGRIVQFATPAELYDRPATQFVARFMGIPNVLPGTVVAQGPSRRFVLAADGGSSIEVAASEPAGVQAHLALRPETLRLVAPGSGEAQLSGTISFTALVGSKINCEVALGSETLHVVVPRGQGRPAVGDAVGVCIDLAHATVLHA